MVNAGLVHSHYVMSILHYFFFNFCASIRYYNCRVFALSTVVLIATQLAVTLFSHLRSSFFPVSMSSVCLVKFFLLPFRV